MILTYANQDLLMANLGAVRANKNAEALMNAVSRRF
jgi:hypothetical protein